MASSTFEQSQRRSVIVGALIAFSAASLAGPPPALAEPHRSNEADRKAARAKLVEGVDALGRGEHQVALESFQQAYALIPSPKIHYDFGLAYLGLGRRADALSAFERFLAEAEDAPADKREKAALQTIALRPQVGVASIVVKGAPDGAAIAVDGRDVGGAPLAKPVYLDPGPHEIAVRLSPGTLGPARRIEIRAGGSAEVALTVGHAGPPVAGAEPTAVAAPVPSAASRSESQAPTAAAGSSSVSTRPAETHANTRRIAALSLGATGLALIGAGVTFGVLAKRESDSLSRDSANGSPPRMPTPFDPGKESRGTTYESLQVIGLAFGAVGLAAGIALYATARGRVTVEPVAVRALAGANVRVSF